MSNNYDNILLERSPDEAPPQRGVNRRDFLKIAGFSFGGALVAGCKPGKVEKAIPFLVKPEEVTPGVSTWYATTCGGCSAGCGVSAKNRDGRPIKLEGITNHPISKGGLCSVGQAHLLSLYDSQRLIRPSKDGQDITWDEVDRTIIEKLDSIKNNGGAIRFLTGTVTSPTVKSLIKKFTENYPTTKHVQYDGLSCSSILDAHEKTHGARLLPHYRFDQAEVIVSFDADFLGTWISPVEFTSAYQAGRTLDEKQPVCSYHVQFESRVSLTGSNADKRVRLSPDEIRKAIQQTASLIAAKAGATSVSSALSGETDSFIKQLAEKLWDARGKSLVVSGGNDVQSQTQINYINHLLGNYGTTVDIEQPSNQKQGNDNELQTLLDEMKNGQVAALFIQGVNPVYDLPIGSQFGEWMKKLQLSVNFTNQSDETESYSQIVCPEPQALESWNDAEPVAGTFTMTQPVIKPFGQTRTVAESISAWMGEKKSSLELIKQEWEKSVYTRLPERNGGQGLQSSTSGFQLFWDSAVYDGFVKLDIPVTKRDFIVGRDAVPTGRVGDSTYNLLLYPKAAMLDGRHAHNPWLQELPDPVTKIVWDNYASVSSATANELGISEGDVVRVEASGTNIELPAHIQPGQHDSVIAIALGYGRKGTDRFTKIGPQWFEAEPTVEEGGLVGKNVAPFIKFENGTFAYDVQSVNISNTGKKHTLACTQEHHSLHVPKYLDPGHGERRPIIQETTFAAFVKNPKAGSFEEHELTTMWTTEDHKYTGHHWGMAIDLNKCTGCSACVVSCQAENNIPLVGKDEVFRNREMTWIRIDRYYDESPNGDITVQHQPMMCQHCGNAPCETVCPVLATVHSDEGLNQQVYNRCVGTRYCSNNCPYKVRRFNWFDYEHGDEMHKLALNPDITIRERGIMEKCSLCVQRIQEVKIQAKKEGRTIRDGEIQPACAQSCPAKAIVFGDMNDTKSELVKQMNNPRHYGVLEEIGVRPSVGYMTLVHNREEGEWAHV
ncbi:MAG: 4Fe-4S dicluster domain-containing protein [Ignavibacteriae bacterium]|nr:4Fe-4S dicluster domain-containing protein [Ignavibacteriota bacterium]